MALTLPQAQLIGAFLEALFYGTTRNPIVTLPLVMENQEFMSWFSRVVFMR